MGTRTVALLGGRRFTKRALTGALAVVAIAAAASPIGATTQASKPAPALPLRQPVVGIAATPTGGGYWRVASDGGVFTSGDAKFYGSTGGMRLNRPIVGIAPTRTGKGYWLVASDGGVFSFGDARFFGSTGAMRLNKPIVGMASTPTGRGYWMVASDGGIFSFGDARFFGSTGAMRLNQPIVGMAATRDGRGYWMVASDGGIFTFGNAIFRGSLGALRLARPIVGMNPSRSGKGYVLVAADGGVFTFGDAKFYGSAAGSCPDATTIGIAASRQTVGYWIGLANARTYAFSPSRKAPKCPLTPADRVARDLFDRLNAERAARGRVPLQWDGALSGYAKMWSAEMSRSGFRHSNIMGLLNDGRLSYVGENIAWAQGAGVASGTLHKMWMQSDGHRNNMLSPTYTVVGIGVHCGSDGKMYATQSFGRLASQGAGAAAPGTSRDPIVRGEPGGPAC
jgi:uncharacterized protein YkwD